MCTGRVMRLARYRPIHVALTRIISVIIRKSDRYMPCSGRSEHAQPAVVLVGGDDAAAIRPPARRSGSRWRSTTPSGCLRRGIDDERSRPARARRRSSSDSCAMLALPRRDARPRADRSTRGHRSRGSGRRLRRDERHRVVARARARRPRRGGRVRCVTSASISRRMRRRRRRSHARSAGSARATAAACRTTTSSRSR